MTRSPLRLDGRRALVTGATAGIGRAIAEAFAREGAAVVISGRDRDRGDRLVEELRATGAVASFVAADLADMAALRELPDAAERAIGPLDVLVNNAGVFAFGPTEEVDEATFDHVIAVNTKATFFLTAALLPRMAGRGRGTVINITTPVAYRGRAGTSVYAASKAAIASLTRTWAVEYGPRGVNVNALSPGAVRTAMAERSTDLEALTATTPAGRPSTPEEIAGAAIYLAGDDARYIHGTTLEVDGGRNV